MIVNAKEMLKIQKQMEQKEKNRPIHSDYCLECGCPKDICCERRGRVEELNKIIELVNGETFDHYPELDSGLVFDKFEFMNYLEKRLLKLQGVEK